MTSEVGIDSVPVEEPNGGRNKREGSPMKKGPWTEEEDVVLKGYVAMYGQGNWSSVHRRTGLLRCGKSCRLRWTNHLKPGLKKGPFTPEEEELIIELQAKIGNKWVQIAAEIPGRTDNDIKNFWSARLKKQQRTKKSLDVCFDEFSEGNQNKELATSSSTNSDSAVLPINKNIKIPTVEFSSQQLYPPGLLDIDFINSFLDIPETSSLDQGFNSSWNTPSVHSIIHPSKHIPGSESSEYHLSFPDNIPSYGNSSSESIWEHKQELPSHHTQMETWSLPCSSIPSLESSYTDLCGLSPQSTGLLDAIPKASFNNSHQQTSRFVDPDSCPDLPFCSLFPWRTTTQ